MIRNVVLHLLNEQPLIADLFAMPQPADGQLVCTNLRTMNGKRPVFIDAIESTFVFPLNQLRFVEIPPGTGAGADDRDGRPVLATGSGSPSADPAANGSGDDHGDHDDRDGSRPATDAAADAGMDLDQDFLRRVREL